MVIDCALFIFSVCAILSTDTVCSTTEPHFFTWLIASAVVRGIDTLNYAWLTWIKRRIDPRHRRPWRYLSIFVRAITILSSAVLVILFYLWSNDLEQDRTGGHTLPRTTSIGSRLSTVDSFTPDPGSNHRNATTCSGTPLEWAIYLNLIMSILQTSSLIMFSLFVALLCAARAGRGCGCLERGDPTGGVVSRAELTALTEVLTFDSLQDPREEIECCICWEAYKPRDRLRSLPCHHYFHRRCIDPWLRNHAGTCPLCRVPIE